MSEDKNPNAASRVTEKTAVVVEDDRTGMSVTTLKRAVLDHLYYTCSKDRTTATILDVYRAIAHTVRDRLVHRWIATQRTYYEKDAKRAYYLSAEYLLGRALAANLYNLGLYDQIHEQLANEGISLTAALEEELDPGLGNGGLGRLAACFVDSMASLALPGCGYGIRYEFGIFEQQIRDGWQVEKRDAWERYGYPWEVVRHEYTVPVNFYGRVEERFDHHGNLQVRWLDTQKVLGVPYDIPVAGYGNNTVNNLRLWAANATQEFNLAVFNTGDYRRAVEEKALSESISKVLYPMDHTLEGKELRLKQQYFFVACSIADIVRRYKKTRDDFSLFADKVAIQLNDTHPAVAVAELMRVLVDEERLPWDKAWAVSQKTLAYTNHTLLPEALEKWPLGMFERLLPRHMSIIYEINHRFLEQLKIDDPNDEDRMGRMSIIEEGGEKQVRMAHLAVVGSHSVNGVAALHSELVKSQLLPDFANFWPERFNNKTNGVTPRRWLLQANPRLAKVISDRIGDAWITDLSRLEALSEYAGDEDFAAQLHRVKRGNKERLAKIIKARNDLDVDLDSVFDVQIKRLHEYKRQLLNCLHIIALYQQVKDDPAKEVVPRTFIFGGKAAPGYAVAKLHIKLINDVAQVVNHDPQVAGRLRVVFLANYSVSLAECIIPAADLSEQISMAGKEASGTGNMKFAMNGALTIGTLDGANIEIREQVGAENFFLFGLNAAEVRAAKAAGYHPGAYIAKSEPLRRALELIEAGHFSPDDRQRFLPVTEHLRHTDTYLLAADFDAYLACQCAVADAFISKAGWTEKVVHNLAHVGVFSSDRTIQQYAEEIWKVKPVPIDIG